MTLLRLNIEIGWLELASISALLIFTNFKKANKVFCHVKPQVSLEERVKKTRRLTIRQQLTREDCVKISTYFRSLHASFSRALTSFSDVDMANLDQLNRWKKSLLKSILSNLFDGLSDGFTANDLTDKFTADFYKSRLFTVISFENVGMDFQKTEMLVCLEYLAKFCQRISESFSGLVQVSSAWCEDEQTVEVISINLTEASILLRDWRVALFFKAEKFSLDELIESLNDSNLQ